jgi:hypothetical protein
MMKYLLPLIIVFGLLACMAKKEAQATTQNESPYPIQVEKNYDPNDSLFIKIDKTACFGMCPTYTAHIYKSGFALLNGKKNLDFIGIHRVWFSPDEMKEIEEKLLALDFMKLEDSYDGPVTDLPSTNLEISYLGQQKQIKGRWKIPESLDAFNDYIHELVQSKNWENTSAPQDEK